MPLEFLPLVDCPFFSLLDLAVTLLQNLCQISHHTLNVSPHCLVKFDCSNCVFSIVIDDDSLGTDLIFADPTIKCF